MVAVEVGEGAIAPLAGVLVARGRGAGSVARLAPRMMRLQNRRAQLRHFATAAVRGD